MDKNSFSVRELTEADVPLIIDYWLGADATFLAGMGADITKLPAPEDWVKMLTAQLNQSYKEKNSYCIIWLVNNIPTGHSNVNKIKFGEEAYMHLHLWKTDKRQKGIGAAMVKITLPYFFDNLQLKKIYCEPYALNPAPNKTVEKVGFTFIKEHLCIPGSFNFEQPAKLWELSYDNYKKLKSPADCSERNTQEAYNNWASQYDTNINKTRDLEGKALRNTLSAITFESCLEIGCGTGKNTTWFIEKAKQITAVDLSEAMLAKAKEKINVDKVQFVQADITSSWTFKKKLFDLVSFSLVLEHIENLDFIFNQASQSLNNGGYVYIGELHPFKQYTGSKARFETENGVQVVDCFTHHVSDFIQSAKKHGLAIIDINEYFDDNNRNEIPRTLTLLLKKI